MVFRKITIFFLFINMFFLSEFLFSQNEKNVLIGTQVLTESNNNFYSRQNGYELLSVTSSECESKNGEAYRINVESFSKVVKTDSSLNVEIKLAENCCFSFLGEIELVNDSILNFIYYGYGGHCACDCVYNLTYCIKNHNDLIESRKIKYLLIKNNKETLRSLE